MSAGPELSQGYLTAEIALLYFFGCLSVGKNREGSKYTLLSFLRHLHFRWFYPLTLCPSYMAFIVFSFRYRWLYLPGKWQAKVRHDVSTFIFTLTAYNENRKIFLWKDI
jgi:hypothetical protein